MLPARVSNPGPLTYESGALPIALRGPARILVSQCILGMVYEKERFFLLSLLLSVPGIKKITNLLLGAGWTNSDSNLRLCTIIEHLKLLDNNSHDREM